MTDVQSASGDALSTARESAAAAAGLDAAVGTLHALLAGMEVSKGISAIEKRARRPSGLAPH